MAEREIESQGFTKDAEIHFKKGQILIGKFLGGKPIEKLKNKILYEFNIMSGTTADTVVYVGPREYQGVDVKVGAKVGLWETAQLKNKLSQVAPGSVVRVVYNDKLSISGGRTCHDYTVKVAE